MGTSVCAGPLGERNIGAHMSVHCEQVAKGRASDVRHNHPKSNGHIMSSSNIRWSAVGALALALVLAGCSGAGSAPKEKAPAPDRWEGASALTAEMVDLEAQFDARLGVTVIDTEKDVVFEYRGGERFAYASTFKSLLAAATLRTFSRDELDEIVTWTQEDLDRAEYAPATTEALASGMTVRDLAEAAVRTSDNAAANLLLERLGGPAAFDSILEKQLGDSVTQFADFEPTLNSVPEGEEANTTTPLAFANDLRQVALGDYLDVADRNLLTTWMSANATGDKLVRASAPEGWLVTDKSGGAGGVRNDVAIAYPERGKPIIMSFMSAKNDPAQAFENELIAEAAAAVFDSILAKR